MLMDIQRQPKNVGAVYPFAMGGLADLSCALVYYFKLGLGFIEAMIEIASTSLSVLVKTISQDDEVKACINDDITSSPKMVAGINQELHNHIEVFIKSPIIRDAMSSSDDGVKTPLDWDDLEHGDIFIRMDQSRTEQWGGVIRLILVQLIKSLERRPEKYSSEGFGMSPILLLLDEFPEYGKIEEIVNAMRVLRSKNVTFAIFCQSLADLDKIYGADTRRAILDNCPYQAVLGANDAETQKYFSAKTGVVRGAARSVSMTYDTSGQQIGYSANVNETIEPAIFPHEFGSLTDIVLFHPNGFSRIEKIRPYLHDSGGDGCARLPG